MREKESEVEKSSDNEESSMFHIFIYSCKYM